MLYSVVVFSVINYKGLICEHLTLAFDTKRGDWPAAHDARHIPRVVSCNEEYLFILDLSVCAAVNAKMVAEYTCRGRHDLVRIRHFLHESVDLGQYSRLLFSRLAFGDINPYAV